MTTADGVSQLHLQFSEECVIHECLTTMYRTLFTNDIIVINKDSTVYFSCKKVNEIKSK